MAHRIILTPLVVLALISAAVAQRRPDLSGSWKVESYSVTTGNGNRPISDSLRLGPVPQVLVISQDERTLTIQEHYVLGRRNAIKHPLDGRAVTNLVHTSDVWKTVPAEFKSEWKGDALVSTFTLSVQGEDAPREYEQTISLSPAGELIMNVRRLGTPHARTEAYRRKSQRP
jgi:hypothetical protein